MEVIEKSNKVFVCERCGSKLRINKPYDLKYGYLDYIPGFLGTGKFVYGHYLICPTCLNKVIVEYDA